jgi:hypothetical protein
MTPAQKSARNGAEDVDFTQFAGVNMTPALAVVTPALAAPWPG